MSHQIESMAYVNSTPWHGLGNQLTANQPVETWIKEAGMNWSISESPVLFNVSDDGMHIKTHAEGKVLYRSDTNTALSVVSNRYKTVQPMEVLNFYKDLVEVGGFSLETAGVLKGGKKLFALAKTGQEANVKGNDKVKAYLLLATSADGSMATTAQFTSVRVVCNNTLQLAIGDKAGAIRVPHSTKFDPKVVKEALGLGLTSWDSFIRNIRVLSQRPVSDIEATNYFRAVLDEEVLDGNDETASRAMQLVKSLYSGAGQGSLLSGTRGTAWGLVNAITDWVDHSRKARNQDYRLDSAWFGQGAAIKSVAMKNALLLTE